MDTLRVQLVIPLRQRTILNNKKYACVYSILTLFCSAKMANKWEDMKRSYADTVSQLKNYIEAMKAQLLDLSDRYATMLAQAKTTTNVSSVGTFNALT